MPTFLTKINRGILILFILIGLGFGMLGCEVKNEDYPLVQLKNETGMSGSFFLASGSIGLREYYFFRYQMPDGGIKSGKVRAEAVTIYEITGTPRFTAIISYDSSSEVWSMSKVIFYIPPNSVQRYFQID